MPATATNQQSAVAHNRFGLGARPIDQPLANPKQWLLGQFDIYEPDPGLFSQAQSSAQIVAAYGEDRAAGKAVDQQARIADRRTMRQEGMDLYRGEVGLRMAASLVTEAPFVERLVHFWSNHFAVSANKPRVTVLAGAFEREAIRPHVLGRFEDMLVAVEKHPAMNIFLDQFRSTGPNSPFAAMPRKNDGRKPGINENLAREILELHTLGVRSGYSQQDVTEFALALTGWSVGRPNDGVGGDDAGAFRFRRGLHEPGARTIIGKTYDQQGEAQALAVLSNLAASQSTAHHIATKLARHFIADDPPASAVDALAVAFTMSGGDLKTVYRALVDRPEAWYTPPAKFKTPWDWTVSALRGLGWTNPGDLPVMQWLNQLGQPVWRPGSPAGYDDIAASWAAPDALIRRVEVGQRLATRTPQGLDPRTLAPVLLPGNLNPRTAQEIARAETVEGALALLLVSPDFQRR